MKFKFNNYSRFDTKSGAYNWYNWKIFMDEPIEVLETVNSVEYRLHQTFPEPIRVVEDRSTRFALLSYGWGEFNIYITIYLNDGSEEHTVYHLDLRKPSGDLVAAK